MSFIGELKDISYLLHPTCNYRSGRSRQRDDDEIIHAIYQMNDEERYSRVYWHHELLCRMMCYAFKELCSSRKGVRELAGRWFRYKGPSNGDLFTLEACCEALGIQADKVRRYARRIEADFAAGKIKSRDLHFRDPW